MNTNMFGPSLDLLLHTIHTSVPISLYRFTMVSRIVQMVGNKTRVFISSKDAVFTQNVGEKKKGPATHESISRNFLFIFELQRKATFQILKIQITFAKLVKFPYSLIFCLLKLVIRLHTWILANKIYYISKFYRKANFGWSHSRKLHSILKNLNCVDFFSLMKKTPLNNFSYQNFSV